MKADSAHSPLPSWFLGELLGTFLLVLFGCGSVCVAVLTEARVGLFDVALVWGLGIAVAIHLTAPLSGAHLNPAVTLSLALWRGFPSRKIPGYLLAQMAGAFLASALLYGCFGETLSNYETTHNIVRGAIGSEATARVFGEFFGPLSPWRAFGIEAAGTAVLLFVILGLTDEGRSSTLTPALIGLTVSLLIFLFGPLTMACFNPARDLAPRLFSALAGWGSLPFSASGAGGWGWLFVYILAPIGGGLLGGALHRLFLSRAPSRL